MSDRQQGAGLTTEGPPRSVLIAAVAVAVAAVAAVLVVAAIRQHPHPHQPVMITPLPAPQADTPECQRLLSALPQRLGDYQRVTPADPAPAGSGAWQAGDGEPVVLRCGLDPPADFVVGAPIQVVNGVQWFEATDTGASTWFTVDRPVYLALTLPQGSGPTPIQQLSDVITKTLQAVPIRPAPPR